MDIEIVEVSPRDGLQNERKLLSTADKVRLVRQALTAGARRIEVTAFVDPRRVPQMADADAVMAAVPRVAGVSYIGLALNQRGVERALAAGCDEVNLVVVATDAFCLRNQGKTTDDTLGEFEPLVTRVQSAGARATVTVGAAFGCPFQGEVPVDDLRRIALRAATFGIDELAIADTIGVAVPHDVGERVRAVRAVVGEIPLRLHLHDTRHTGIANAQAGIDAGVRVLDASLGGIGGCPFAPDATGNIATEDLLYLLERSQLAHGWSLPRLAAIVAWLEDRLGTPVPGLAAKAGFFPEGIAS
jgi:hydroxymethylglutaryl-CoA lyase